MSEANVMNPLVGAVKLEQVIATKQGENKQLSKNH